MRCFQAFVATVVITVAAGTARAQAPAAVQKMTDLNKRALGEYDARIFEAARDTLLEAVVIGKEAGLATHKLMARTYLHLGAVYVDGLKERAKGVRYLWLALKVRSDIELTPSLVTPTLTAAFEEARSQKAEPTVAAPPPPRPPPPPPPVPVAVPVPLPAPAPAPVPVFRKPSGPDEPDLPASIPDPLYCPNPDEAPPRQAIALRCVVQPGIAASRVLLFYRIPGGEKFSISPTARSPKGWYNGLIPAAAVVGKSIQYYFEARDSADKPVANRGRSDSPEQLFIREGAPPVGKGAIAGLRFQKEGEAAVNENENPLDAIEREKQMAELEATIHRRAPGSVWIGFGIGTGAGWHGREKLEYLQNLQIDSGFAFSGLFHLAPEIGYQVNEHLGVSIQGRHQFIPAEGTGDLMMGSPATGANGVLLKVSYFFGSGNLQGFASGVLGVGDVFRLVIPPHPTADAKTTQPRNDSLRGGPVAIGPGLGFLYHFTKRFAYLLELKAMVGAPKIAAVLDATTGLQFSF